MSSGNRLECRFWGVRGSFPTPEAANLGYGGNTSCLEIRYGNEPPVVFDAGSGLHAFGRAFAERPEDGSSVSILLSHYHWDHIHGFPLCPLLYRRGHRIDFYAVDSPEGLRSKITRTMEQPYFAPEQAVRAEIGYRQLEPEGTRLGSLRIRAFPLNHPGGSSGFRIDAPGASVVYATDHEAGDPPSDERLRDWARDADILILDAQYTPEEYPSRIGWGHSTWLDAARTARDAGVGRLVLFHHDPEHGDDVVARIERETRAIFENTIAAREGLTISP